MPVVPVDVDEVPLLLVVEISSETVVPLGVVDDFWLKVVVGSLEAPVLVDAVDTPSWVLGLLDSVDF